VLPPILISILIEASIVVILCVGFTFTYMMEKFPNFAHPSLALVGTVVSFGLVQLSGYSPYQAIPISTIACGLLGLVLYGFLVRPIKATGAREITLTFAFFVLAQIIASLINIFSYWYLFAKGAPTSGFYFYGGDFEWGGYPGVFIVSVPACLILVAVLWFFLTKVKQGVAFRAVAEDEQFASSLGINIEGIHLMTWFITGALAGFAGGLIPLWRYTGLDANQEFLVLVMTGSVVGGLATVAGAVVGGFTVVFSQKLLMYVAVAIAGVDTLAYESLYPMAMVVVILMLQPEGIMGAFDRSNVPARPLNKRIRDFPRTVSERVLKAIRALFTF
jgi:branched-chain amino acid transport system permease protein